MKSNQILTGNPASAAAGIDEQNLERILALLRHRTGTDFGCYRPATVIRRVLNRMISVRSEGLGDYLDLLDNNVGEARQLAERITIKVSRFYRNPLSFDLLRERVIPELAAARAADRPLRVWSAGCGYGEEAYTLAMLLEELGVPGQIEATDIDLGALRIAEAAVYAGPAFAELPAALCSRFVSVDGEQHRISAPVRDRVRFSVHDLTSSAPAPWPEAFFDLILCRNVLIYFAPQVKERALTQVRSVLRADGYLGLGEAEWPMSCIASTVTTLAHKARIFRAVAQPR